MDFFFISFSRSNVWPNINNTGVFGRREFHRDVQTSSPWNIIFNGRIGGGKGDLINFPYPPFPLIFFLRGNYTKLWISIAARSPSIPPFLSRSSFRSFIPSLPFPTRFDNNREVSGLFRNFLHAPRLEFLAATIHGRVYEGRSKEKRRGAGERGREGGRHL